MYAHSNISYVKDILISIITQTHKKSTKKDTTSAANYIKSIKKLGLEHEGNVAGG